MKQASPAGRCSSFAFTFKREDAFDVYIEDYHRGIDSKSNNRQNILKHANARTFKNLVALRLSAASHS